MVREIRDQPAPETKDLGLHCCTVFRVSPLTLWFILQIVIKLKTRKERTTTMVMAMTLNAPYPLFHDTGIPIALRCKCAVFPVANVPWLSIGGSETTLYENGQRGCFRKAMESAERAANPESENRDKARRDHQV